MQAYEGHDLKLQQYLPFTVLKLERKELKSILAMMLQQYLPFTVLKLARSSPDAAAKFMVATVLTVYGIETLLRLCHH